MEHLTARWQTLAAKPVITFETYTQGVRVEVLRDGVLVGRLMNTSTRIGGGRVATSWTVRDLDHKGLAYGSSLAEARQFAREIFGGEG